MERAKKGVERVVGGGDAKRVDGLARSGSRLGLGRKATVRKSEISRPFTAQSGSVDERGGFERDGYGDEEKGSWGMGSPVPSYHSLDEEKEDWSREGGRGDTVNGNRNREKEPWHRIEVNGTIYTGRERGASAYMEGREIVAVNP